jgi:hypothetical protein
MKMKLGLAIMLTLAAALTTSIHSQQQGSTNCPMHQKHQEDKSKSTTASGEDHSERHAEMNKRGDEGMGFSQAKTTHHFLLALDGGSIEVEANDSADQASRDQIRQHLASIAQMFADGNFDTPMFVHAGTPSGVAAMKRLRSEIKYKFEKTERGGRVRIQTGNAEALAAIHEFLRFQIKEHRTGDPLEAS